MKKDLHVIATLDRQELLEDMVEKLASRRIDAGYAKARIPKTWRAMDTSTIEAFVTGTVEFDYNEELRIRMPFVTCMIFICAKEKMEPYNLCWTTSFN